jgi:tetratricopeptide (TPR) repeat protein
MKLAPIALSKRRDLALVLALWAYVCGGRLSPLFGHGDLHDQIAVITRQLAADPNNPGLLLKRAELFRLHSEWSKALDDLDRANPVDGSNPRIELLRAKVLLGSGQSQLARLSLDHFLEQQPEHVDALITRSRVLLTLGQNIDAAADLSKAIAASPTPDPDFYLQRAEALFRAKPPRIEEALRGLDEGMLKLGAPVLALAAVDLELTRLNYDAALERLDRIASASARPESWLVRRGDILSAAGRTGEGRQAFSEALEAIGSLPPHLRRTAAVQALDTRARAALKASNPTNAPPAHEGQVQVQISPSK